MTSSSCGDLAARARNLSWIYASAKFYKTPVEGGLPLTMHERDDRLEALQGAVVTTKAPNHPILEGVAGNWSPLSPAKDEALCGSPTSAPTGVSSPSSSGRATRVGGLQPNLAAGGTLASPPSVNLPFHG
jgi:hypothetical protein